jgi:hypothetical protein
MSRSRPELTVNKNVFWPELYVTGPGLNVTSRNNKSWPGLFVIKEGQQSDCGIVWIYAILSH